MRGEHDAAAGLATAADRRLELAIADAERRIRELIALGRTAQARAEAKHMAALIGQRSPQQA